MNYTNVIVKDYLYDGNYIFGTFYAVEKGKDGKEIVKFILDDGDIYSEEELKSDYNVKFISSLEIIEAFKSKFGVEPAREPELIDNTTYIKRLKVIEIINNFAKICDMDGRGIVFQFSNADLNLLKSEVLD